MKNTKNILIILTLVLVLLQCTFAYEKKTYINSPSQSNYIFNRMNGNYIPRNYNYISPYQYRMINSNNTSRLRRLRLLRNLNRIQRGYYNYLTFNNPLDKVFDKGQLTGYSVPVNSSDAGDIYYDYNSGKKIKNNSRDIQMYQKPPSSANTELYSMPTTDNSRTSKGRKDTDGGGIAGKTGVTIIWD